jgi:hypothetical protein
MENVEGAPDPSPQLRVSLLQGRLVLGAKGHPRVSVRGALAPPPAHLCPVKPFWFLQETCFLLEKPFWGFSRNSNGLDLYRLLSGVAGQRTSGPQLLGSDHPQTRSWLGRLLSGRDRWPQQSVFHGLQGLSFPEPEGFMGEGGVGSTL